MSPIPFTSKALQTTSAGSPLTLADVPTPEPNLPHSVLVKVSSTALNPHDSLVLSTGMLIPSFPFIPGADVAGTVVKLAPDVTKYKVGDVIFGQTVLIAADDSGPRFADYAGLREYALIESRSSAKVSDCGFGEGDEAIEKTVTMPTNAVAAVWGFVDKTGFNLPLSSVFGGTQEERKNDGFDANQHDLVVIGGGSQLGKLVVQFARIMGWRKIIVVAARKNEDELKAMGATVVIDRHASNADQIKEIRGIVGDDLKHCFNAVAHDTTVAVGVLSNSVKGHLNNTTFGEVAEKDLAGEKKAGYGEGLSQGMSMNNLEAAELFWKTLPSWLKDGVLKVPAWRVIEGLDADKAMEVLNKYRDGGTVPKHTHFRP